ncbi:MAG: hypothetical protein C4519_24855 [Desulfobacteraceae bacterium]|nr:MAG: hypothetical protein C4519_24855 [Desulfobacteraceae bacterium]
MNRIFAVLVAILVMAGCSGSGPGSGPSGDNNSNNDNSSGSVPPGTFWCSVTVSAPECVPVVGAPGVEVCAPKAVNQVDIVEESTAEILGTCSFGDGNVAMTGLAPSGYRFWCERFAADGGTQIKISSMRFVDRPDQPEPRV